jgi:hypothetical protein
MALELPIYVILGERPVMMEETPDGGAQVLGWDFDKRELVPALGSLAEVVGMVPHCDDPFEALGDREEVTREQFYAKIEELKARPRP